MKVFPSWSGERSLQVAVGLRDWLGHWFKDLDCWVSEKDIHAGERWAEVLASQLHATDFAILCIAEETLEKPWILFEAGAISKAVGKTSRVIPYLLFGLGHDELPEPLRQFQSVSADREGSFKLIQSVNDVRSDKQNDDLLKETFVERWPDLDAVLTRAGDTAVEPWRSLFVSEFPRNDYDQHLANAKEVWLVGVSLENTLRSNTDAWKDRLRNQVKLRVLLADPDPSVIEHAVLRKSSREVIDSGLMLKSAEIKASVDSLREIREVLGGKGQAGTQHKEQLQIRTTRYPLAYGAHAMDPNESCGVLYIKFYPYQIQNEQKPKLVLRANRDREYKWFLRELDNLFSKAGEEIDLDKFSA
ncbi:MAG: TIR domain-containing protein [Nitrospira sp.]|nr:TIR domain-containing protein [Nitrospira sp.]